LKLSDLGSHWYHIPWKRHGFYCREKKKFSLELFAQSGGMRGEGKEGGGKERKSQERKELNS
jgi:hypothetical protein